MLKTDLRALVVGSRAARGVEFKQDKEQDGEAPQRRTTVGEEWQGYTDNRTETYDHADIDAEMEYQI